MRPRIVASLTTLPSRIAYSGHTLRSLLRQSEPLDAVYFNLPYRSSKGQAYKIPLELKQLAREDQRLILHRCKHDQGPITKLLPTLRREVDPETLIITFDDDLYIHRDVVKLLLTKARLYPGSCLSFSGWCVGSFPFPYQLTMHVAQDFECDWLQGVHAILYPRRVLDERKILTFRATLPEPIRRLLFLNDDHWLAGYLERNKIRKIAINYPAKLYFIDLCTEAHNYDAISFRSGFYWEVHTICEYFKKLGLYRRSYQASHSLLFPLYGLIFLSLFFLFLTRKYHSSLPAYLGLNLLLGYLAYKFIRHLSAEQLVLDRIRITA